MTIVKCRYCHKEIDKDTAYSPAKGRYYCNEEHYLKHEGKKQKDRENYMNIKYCKKCTNHSTREGINYGKKYRY